MIRNMLSLCAIAMLATGCVTLGPPPVEKLAALPVVTYPDAPKVNEFVYKLPAGKPIATRVSIQGSALASEAKQTLVVTLPRDIYVHKDWVSEDMKDWKRLRDMLSINLSLSLPSDVHPKDGEIVLQVDRNETKK